MGIEFPTYVTAVQTLGFAVLRNTWSDRLRERLAVAAPAYRSVRDAYLGLPLRLVEEVAGEQVFSSARTGVPTGWHRWQTAPSRDGAPAAFVPGLCLAGPVGGASVELRVVPGSSRLSAGTPVPEELATTVELRPADVAVFDARCARRWSEPATVFQLCVVRPWLEPEQDGREFVGPDGPAPAVRFAGWPTAPAGTAEEWLFDRHDKRSATAEEGSR